MITILSNIKAYFVNRNYIWYTNLTVATAAASSETIDMRTYSGGTLIFKSGTATTITFHTSDAMNSGFTALTDHEGGSYSVTVGANVKLTLPPGLFGAPYLRLVGNNAAVVTVFLKG